MKRFTFLLFILFFFNIAFADEIALERAPINIRDTASIKRGAKFFASICITCHTMIYMRYNQLAQDAGVRYDRMPINIKKWPNDVKPPDLTLEVSRRGVDWIYTYLHSFYMDPTRPTGTNNLLVPDTAMPGIIMAYQGQQVLVPKHDIGTELYSPEYQWYDLVELKTKGSMSPEQFDATMTDLVNFLAYASEPYKVEQENIGVWVILFLIVLFVLMYLLKRSYWSEIKKE